MDNAENQGRGFKMNDNELIELAKEYYKKGRAEMKQEINKEMGMFAKICVENREQEILKMIEKRIIELKKEVERETISQEELNQLYARINELKNLKQKIRGEK